MIHDIDDYIKILKAGANLTQSARLGLINLLLTMACSTAAQVGNVTLIQGNITPLNVGSSFPHIVELNGALSAEDETCEWQQHKSRMTHIKAQLQDEQGQPVLGSTLQEGGVKLQLTLLNATTGQPLSDADNPRPQEGLFSGVAGRYFDPTVILTDTSSHTFKCKVLLLSSDIDGALVKIKVSGPGLCFVTRAFRSRARSNKSDTESRNKRPRSLPSNSEIDTDINLNDFSDLTSEIDTDIDLNDISDLASVNNTDIDLNDISDLASVNDTGIDFNGFSNFSDEDVMLGAQPAEFLAAALCPADDAMVAEGLFDEELMAAIEASKV